jgi:hypothetical protein
MFIDCVVEVIMKLGLPLPTQPTFTVDEVVERIKSGIRSHCDLCKVLVNGRYPDPDSTCFGCEWDIEMDDIRTILTANGEGSSHASH